MTDIDVIARDRLDRRYPPPEREPDWDDVLERLARTKPRSKRNTRYGFVLAGVAVASALVVVLIAPWRGSPSFTEQALAALGTGRYVHAVFMSTSADRRLLDLASGRTRPVVERAEVVYDTKTGSEDSRWFFNASVFALGPGGTLADPAVIQFATGYRRALRRGEARIVGETTVDGREAKIIRFPNLRFPNPLRIRGGRVIKYLTYEDVAVAADSYVPLWVRPAQWVFPHPHLPGHIYAFPCPCTRVVSIRSSDRRATLPTPLKRPRSSIGDITDVRDLDAADASTALGHGALWAGRSIDGATLRKVRLQRVTTYDTSVPRWPEIGNAAGLRLDYRGARGLVQIFQAASAQAGYSFGTSFQLLPQPGEALIGCYRCEVRGAPPLWLAQFRQSGLFVVVRSKSRSLVVQAARALVPIP